MDVQGEDQLTEQVQQQKSKILQRLLEALAPDFNKLQDKVNEVFQQGRREGLNDMEIGEMVRDAMKDHYTYRTIRNVLPNTAKHIKFANKAENISASEREPLDLSDKVTVEETQFNTKGMGVAITDDSHKIEDISPKAESIQLPEDIHNQIVDLQRENKFLKDALTHFKHDNSILLEQLKKYEQLPNNDALVNQIDELKKELQQVKQERDFLNSVVDQQQQKPELPPKQEPKKDWLLQK